MDINESIYETLLTLCQRRHSVRSFLQQPLSAEQIEKIRAIAATSPYASGRKNWELLVITDIEIIAQMTSVVRDQVNKLAAQVRKDFSDSFNVYAKYFSIFESAPAIFVPTFRNAASFSQTLFNEDAKNSIAAWERDNYIKSISCVSMLVLLAAESLGLSACYMTGPLIAEKELAALIQVKPGYSIGALIPVGYASTKS